MCRVLKSTLSQKNTWLFGPTSLKCPELGANQTTIHWILTQIWTKLSKFTKLQKNKHEITRISYHIRIPFPYIISVLKRWLPLSFRSVPFPSFQHQTFVLRALVLSIRWTHWNHRVLRKTHKILVFMKIPHPKKVSVCGFFVGQETTFVTKKTEDSRSWRW